MLEAADGPISRERLTNGDEGYKRRPAADPSSRRCQKGERRHPASLVSAKPVLDLPRNTFSSRARKRSASMHPALRLPIHRDEIMSLPLSFWEEHSEARGFYLTAWRAINLRLQLHFTGEIYIPHLSFSLLGSTQPGVLSAFVSEASRVQQRRHAAAVQHDSLAGRGEDFETNRQARQRRGADRAYATFSGRQDHAGDTKHRRRWMRHSLAAVRPRLTRSSTFSATFRNTGALRLRSSALESHLTKYKKLVRLALIGTSPMADRPVSGEAVDSASLEPLPKSRGDLRLDRRRTCSRTGDQWRVGQGDLAEPLARELIRKQWMGLTDPVVVKALDL